MARCRNLKPGFFKNEALAELDALVRLLFAGLWCYADRDGRLEDRPKRLKAEILPYSDLDIDDALNQLSRGDDPFIVRYQVGDGRYIQVLKFREHQSPHSTEKPSVIPEFPLSNESLTQARQLAIKGREVDGAEVTRKGSAEGKPKQEPKRKVDAADVPVPPKFETPEVRQAIADWLEYKAARGEAYKDAAYFGRKVDEFTAAGPQAFIAAVNSSIGSNYSGLFPAKGSNGNATTPRVGAGQRFKG